jgi:hypothetical protein
MNVDSLRRHLRTLTAGARDLDAMLADADPKSLLPLETVLAEIELSAIRDRLDQLADWLANSAAPSAR